MNTLLDVSTRWTDELGLADARVVAQLGRFGPALQQQQLDDLHDSNTRVTIAVRRELRTAPPIPEETEEDVHVGRSAAAALGDPVMDAGDLGDMDFGMVASSSSAALPPVQREMSGLSGGSSQSAEVQWDRDSSDSEADSRSDGSSCSEDEDVSETDAFGYSVGAEDDAGEDLSAAGYLRSPGCSEGTSEPGTPQVGRIRDEDVGPDPASDD